MSATAVAWAGIAAILVLWSLKRPVWAVALYLMTFFAAPHLWWWGRDLPSLRYALIAGLLLLLSLAFQSLKGPHESSFPWGPTHRAAIAIAFNATVVHFVVSSSPSVSLNNYVELLKYVLLFFLMCHAVRTRDDLRILIMAVAIGAAYIGYEATINERGSFIGSRLEGIGAPAADTSNSLASVMLLALPLAGSLLVGGKRRHWLTAILASPLILNVVLLCNSRGAFLGLIGAGATVLVLSRGATRKQAFKALALGGLTLFLLMGDPKILERFSTTFVGSENRDASATARLDVWQAGLLMLRDYPLGDGGGSFKFVHGYRYLREVTGGDAIERSLHNGYLTEATEWGVQGLILRLLFIGAACLHAYRTSVWCRTQGQASDALLGICYIAALVGFLIATVFGSFFSNEWSFWIVAILIRYGDLYRAPSPALAAASVAPPVGVSPAWVPRAERS